ncbi:MAG: O-antigen ligase family protein [Cyanobacteria bacterium P01_G01_bin.67]
MFLKNHDIQPQNIPEQVIWYLAIATLPLYLIGSLYIVVPLTGTALTIYALWQWRVQTVDTPLESRVYISPTAWVWLVTSLIILLALVVSHFNFDLGLKQIVFSTVNNWYRRWAIIPMFILGGHFLIRPKLMYRAGCIIALQAAALIVVGTILTNLGVPELAYDSPLAVFGGGGDHYEVHLLQNALQDRIYAFSPWYTSTGTLGNFFFFLVWEEKAPKWRLAGLISALILIAVSQSRAALLCVPFVLVVVWLVRNIFSTQVQLLSSLGCFILGIFAFQIGKIFNFAQDQFNNFRGKDSLYSSRIRNILYRATIKKWWTDAPIWGHGRLEETGPRYLAQMPLGSHNTWLGALYTYGLVGFTAVAIACSFTFFNLIIRARQSNTTKVGLCLFISLFVSSFTDSVEYVNYAYWHAWLFIGIALRQRQEEIELTQEPINSQVWQVN